MNIHIDGPINEGASSLFTVIISPNTGGIIKYGYRIPNQYLSEVTKWCDPFVIASIFLIMRTGEDVYVNGSVSPSLLENLDRFQEIWSSWRPGTYKHVNISASIEHEQPSTQETQFSSILFSGGIDSAFAFLKHFNGDMRRVNKQIQFGIVTLGMGGYQNNAESRFAIELKDLMLIAASKRLNLLTVQTDWQYVMYGLGFDIYEIFAAGFISCLHLFRNNVSSGIIGSTDNTRDFIFKMPCASSPLTDGLLGTKHYQIINEGSPYSRVQKISYLSQWGEYLTHMRVCNDGGRTTRNCGVCEKCVRTSLSFHVAGIKIPSTLMDYSEVDINNIEIASETVYTSLINLLLDAKNAHLENEEWYQKLSAKLAKYSY